ncbi:hypothetical protein [uncultured Leifsonia sp.]|uniref:hypothetical protein n=1 Tax=Leifsonia sp. TaxID=1870902 RepID=UPI0028D2E756|nr:hypothetical protein [uncultured Leifsonia sp.]
MTSQKRDELVIGAEPRVDLLPPEVLAARQSRSTRRALGLGVIGVLVLTLGAIGGSSLLAASANQDLVAAQNRTTDLLTQQQKYMEVRKVQDQVKVVQAAQQVGASTEIDWRDYLVKVQQTLPPEVSLKVITVDSASPLAAYAQSTAPLQGARIATLSFTADSPTLPQVPSWLDSLAKLPGFVDAVPGSVTLDQQSKTYTVNIVMHINQDAYTKRFGTEEKK